MFGLYYRVCFDLRLLDLVVSYGYWLCCFAFWFCLCVTIALVGLYAMIFYLCWFNWLSVVVFGVSIRCCCFVLFSV